MAMSEWQLIETAPRDGTHILGWDGSCRAVIYWRIGVHCFWELAVAGSYAEDAEFEPTHWIAIPEPPKA